MSVVACVQERARDGGAARYAVSACSAAPARQPGPCACSYTEAGVARARRCAVRGASQDPVFVVFFGARSGSECAWVAEWRAFDVASVDALGNPRLKRRQQKPFQEALEQACSHVGLVLELGDA